MAEETAAVQHLSGLVREKGVLGGILAVGAALELGQVAVVVALHFQVEHLRFPGGGSGDQVVVQQLQDAGADLTELVLHLPDTRSSVKHCQGEQVQQLQQANKLGSKGPNNQL